MAVIFHLCSIVKSHFCLTIYASYNSKLISCARNDACTSTYARTRWRIRPTPHRWRNAGSATVISRPSCAATVTRTIRDTRMVVWYVREADYATVQLQAARKLQCDDAVSSNNDRSLSPFPTN